MLYHEAMLYIGSSGCGCSGTVRARCSCIERCVVSGCRVKCKYRARGYADVIAPPTFAVLIAQQCDRQLIGDPEAGIDFSRVVHGEQRFLHHRPLTAGDAVIGTLHVDTVREAGGHAMVTTRTELATEAGEPVCTATSTIVIRGGE